MVSKNKTKQNKTRKQTDKQTKKQNTIIGWEGVIFNEQEKSWKKKKKTNKNTFLSRSWIYLYNDERIGTIDKGVPEICLYQSDGTETFLSKCCPNAE